MSSIFENYERLNSIFRCYLFLVPFRPFKKICQGIIAIEALDSDDHTETNDDVDGLVCEL